MIDSRDQHEERGGMRMLAWSLITLVLVVAYLALFACACGVQNLAGGSDVSLPGFGNVFVCELPSGPSELCWKDDNAAELGALLDATCAPTERHAGPCLYRCPGETGCNALQGCYCP